MERSESLTRDPEPTGGFGERVEHHGHVSESPGLKPEPALEEAGGALPRRLLEPVDGAPLRKRFGDREKGE